MPSAETQQSDSPSSVLAYTKGGQPKYLQIVERLRSNIKEGHYRHGAWLPSESELVCRFGVSRMTVVKAMQLLRQEGFQAGAQTQAIAYRNYQIGGGFSGQSLFFTDGVGSNIPETMSTRWWRRRTRCRSSAFRPTT